jgi:2-oxoglutarate ferredoxin oxidoreductase subunit delta
VDIQQVEHVTLDPERCQGCMLCLDICPNELFVPSDQLNQSGSLTAQMRYPEYCINCMRCVSICPEQAFDLPAQPEFNLPGHIFGLSLRWHRWVTPHDR